jgi:AsmA protein
LALGPLLDAFGAAPAITGNAQVDADLHGAGVSPHAIAASLSGHLGLAMVDGDVSNALLEGVLGGLLRTAKLPVEFGGGQTHVRCLALRMEAKTGAASVDALALDTTRLALTGSGSLNLGDETMQLHLHPMLRMGSIGAEAPVEVVGPWLAPKVGLERIGPEGRVGAVIGALRGGEADVCGPALSAARGGQAGPTPSAPPAGASHGPTPGDFLQLLRRKG